jgi:hypothetical protein
VDIFQLPEIEVITIDSIERLVDCLPRRSKYFTLLLAWDAPDIQPDKLMEFFCPLVNRGLVYFCAWGSRCEEVHDAIDLCVAARQVSSGERDNHLMSTWHRDESLEEALWFFNILAIPTDNHIIGDFERYAVAVGNPEYAERITRILTNQVTENEQQS